MYRSEHGYFLLQGHEQEARRAGTRTEPALQTFEPVFHAFERESAACRSGLSHELVIGCVAMRRWVTPSVRVQL